MIPGLQIIMAEIDKSSYIPYYVQIKHILKDRIRNGEYLEGMRLPSENELAQEFSVTRMTVRKSLDDLKREGMIVTQRGKGSIVAKEKIEQSLQRFYQFGKEIGDTGIPAKSKVVSMQRCTPPAEISEIFGDVSERRYHKLVRLRYFKDHPVSLEYSYIPCDIAPDLESDPVENTSLAELLEQKYRHSIVKATEYLLPRISDEYESHLLGIQVHSPVFLTERITRGERGRVLEFRRSIIRGDMVKFSTELT